MRLTNFDLPATRSPDPREDEGREGSRTTGWQPVRSTEGLPHPAGVLPWDSPVTEGLPGTDHQHVPLPLPQQCGGTRQLHHQVGPHWSVLFCLGFYATCVHIRCFVKVYEATQVLLADRYMENSGDFLSFVPKKSEWMVLYKINVLAQVMKKRWCINYCIIVVFWIPGKWKCHILSQVIIDD